MFELFLEQKGAADQFRSDGRPTAPRPRHGAGKTWTYGLFPAAGTGGTGTALSRAPMWRSASQTTLPPDLTTARRAQRGRPPKSQPNSGHFLPGTSRPTLRAHGGGQLPRNLRLDRTPVARRGSRWSGPPLAGRRVAAQVTAMDARFWQ